MHRFLRRTLAAAGYCAVLVPVSVAALAALATGRRGAAVRWWRALRSWLLRAGPAGPGAPAWYTVLGHAVTSLLLGAAALVPLAFQVVFVLRSVLYGFVDRGPYDTSWGGPSRAGAWFVHFLVGIPISLAGLAALAGIAALHQRLTAAALDGERRPRWLAPATAAVVLVVAGFLVAWSRQI